MADENNATTGDTPAGDVNANGAGTPPAPRTCEEFLATAPPEIAAVLNEGISLRTQKKKKLVDGILANSQAFTADELNAKDIPELEKLHSMSKPVASYEGRPFPTAAGREGISGNTQRENQNSVPTPPKAFEVNPRRRADYSEQGAGASAAAN